MKNAQAKDQEVFEELRRLPPGDERDSRLQQLCGPDADLRQRVSRLLNSYDQASGFLETPPWAVEAPTAVIGGSTTAEKSVDEPLGATLGQYELLELLGAGGMGRVFKALDPRLNRIVAIKSLAPSLCFSATARARFVREAQAAAAVSHDHVVTIHGVEEAGDVPYIVMEYVAGQSLEDRIERSGPLELKEILRIGMQTAAGLAAAHAQGLVHRDVKPANILLENSVERVKITDFGLARAVDDTTLTQTGIIAGTPQYMAPEQARGEAVDHRADLFSFGSVLYALCAGKAPFRAASAVATLREVCDKRPEPVQALNPDIPDWLVQVIDKLHAKNPEDRFQSASEVADLLGASLAELQQPSAGGVAKARREFAKSRRKLTALRPVAISAAAVLVLVAGVGMSESTGVTNFLATVIRIAQGEGMLVVEVEDPGVRVRIEEADVVVTGAGVEELRLRPGEYTVRATKDGQRVQERLVTVSRGERELLKISREAPSPVTRSAEPLPLAMAKRASEAKLVGRLEGHGDSLMALRFTPNGDRLLSAGGIRSQDGDYVAGSDFSLRLWDVATQKLLHELRGHEQPVRALAVSPDGPRAISGGDESTLYVWDLEGGELQRKFFLGRGAITSLAFVPGTDWAVVGTWGWADVCDLTTGLKWRSLVPSSVSVAAVAVSRDGRYAAVCGRRAGKGFVSIHDLETFQARELEGPTERPATLAFSSDGERLYAGVWDGTVYVWQCTTGSLLDRLDLRNGSPRASVTEIALSSDDRYLLAASWGAGQGLRLIDLHGPATLWFDSDTHKNVAISPDQRFAASCNWHSAGTIFLWQLPKSVWKTDRPQQPDPLEAIK